MSKDIERRDVLIGGLAMAAAASSSSSGWTQSPLAGDEITKLDALSLSQAIYNRDYSCAEVMSAYLDRIEAVNSPYNAIVYMPERSKLMEEATKKDKALAAGDYHGWMHGFPHAVKDLSDVAGMPTTEGSPLFKDFIAQEDSMHIATIRNAGAIFIGKTNTPEFGFGSNSYNPVYGTTKNAYDTSKVAGGSSGGAAVSLALEMQPVADGSDMMGSLRNPAAFNNVIGFRPSQGRVARNQDFMVNLSVAGPMGRNVSDTAKLLSTMAGFDARDPLSISEDPEQFAGSLKRDFKGARIGWLGDLNGYLAMEEDVLELCQSSLAAFEELGCKVEEASFDFSMEELWQTWLTLRHWSTINTYRPLYDNPAERALLKPELIWEVEGSLNLTGRDIALAGASRSRWYEAVHKAFESYDFLISPSAQVFPFDADVHWPKEIAGVSMDTYHRWMEVVVPATMSSCPAANVPAGFSKTGLPMGIQIIGPRKQDMSVLQMAYAYEQVTRWNLDNHPK